MELAQHRRPGQLFEVDRLAVPLVNGYYGAFNQVFHGLLPMNLLWRKGAPDQCRSEARGVRGSSVLVVREP
jgi:hypothetical protein